MGKGNGLAGASQGGENCRTGGQGHLGFVKTSYAQRRVFPKTAGGRWENNLRMGIKKPAGGRLGGALRALFLCGG